ncbi:heme exporter protein CcmD [Lysobacter humi (ex Lee et al. 2017)]
MNYAGYVAAAYAMFFAFLAWDFLVPWLQVRRELRAARLRARRAVGANPAPVSGTDR